MRGIERMVEEDRYCIDILTQIERRQDGARRPALQLLDDHVNHCVADALASGDREVATEKSRELLAAVDRFARVR